MVSRTSPGPVDRDAIARIIGEGLRQQLDEEQIADRILARLEHPGWAKAMSHPMRATIVRLLRDQGPLSPVRVREQLDQGTLGMVAYHFRILERLGLIEVDRTVQRRGAVEHIYRLAG